MNISELIKTHQQKIVLSVGYLLVASLAFGIGKITSLKNDTGIGETIAAPSNYSENSGSVQSATIGNCNGKIKGNINAKGKKIYHVPGGSFYDRTSPEQCFETEEAARAAGFTKSSR